ncbi:MAG: hypothetical protein A2Y79_12315 [Deltaproteobacteria bacterium RBG_13_43_22]|nr:MAG: hypothetical protein A2Y79_12315 [Deltaproteobacteria bacterium RBG_13_43_22]
MAGTQSQPVNMLAVLINDAVKGKKVTLRTKFIGEVLRVQREGRPTDAIILSVEYSGKDDGKPFKLKKNYLFADDSVQHPLECLLIANNRLKMDYHRLKKAGIPVKEDFFTFENSFKNLPEYISKKRTPLRLQDFIHLCRAGVPVSVQLILKFPDLTLKQDGIEKKGYACVAEFTFKTKDGGTRVEKLYGFGSHEDTKGYQAELRTVATKRLERDCERLRRAGMKVEKLRF